jgi:hypothetical protein
MKINVIGKKTLNIENFPHFSSNFFCDYFLEDREKIEIDFSIFFKGILINIHMDLYPVRGQQAGFEFC